ncbi:hypothetical protein EBU99_02790 [bacterium]|nr:hypothetical protein [bacterium]
MSLILRRLGLGLVLFWGCFASKKAFSAQGVQSTIGSVGEPSGIGSESEYYQVLGRLEQMDANGHRAALVSSEFFQSLSWIGRTACVNYVCGILSIDQCRRVLDRGLLDDALVVRDHALRVMLHSSQFTEQEKRSAAEKILGDQRNYRKGRPFWIVDRAKGFLIAGTGKSSAGQ